MQSALNEMTGDEDNLYDKRYDETKKVMNIDAQAKINYHQIICSNALKEEICNITVFSRY